MDSPTPHAVGRAFSALGSRNTQEDRFLVWEGLHPVAGPLHIYAVFDGHAGTTSADICRLHLAPLILNHSLWRRRPPPLDAILRDVIAALELKCMVATRDSRSFDGTTLCVALVCAARVVVANVGDSRAVLVTADNKPLQITVDHRLTHPAERARVLSAGAVIKRGRMLGIRKDLEITRALGDRDFKDVSLMTGKPPGKTLIAVPDVFTHTIHPADHALLLATDGFWDIDFLENDELARMAVYGLRGDPDVSEEAAKLVQEALRFRNTDNVTLVLIKLNLDTPPQPADLQHNSHFEYLSYDAKPKVPPDVVCRHWEASPLPPSKSKAAARAFRSFVKWSVFHGRLT